MKITSTQFDHNKLMPAKFTCDGQGVNPPLTFVDVPRAAKSLALIVDDPDAPSGDWVHWTVFNMNGDTVGILENNVPKDATEGVNSFGDNQYGSPCPPTGTHRYFFKLYALDIILYLDKTAKKADIEKAMSGHIIEQAELIGLYQRP